MKRILVFSFFPAFVPPSNGGESRLYNFYKSLSRFHHITLLSSSHLNAEEEKIDHGGNFIERRIPKDSHFEKKWSEWSEYSSGGDLSAVCITACGQLPTLLHSAYLEEYENADIIIHDSPFTVYYDLFLGVDHKTRIYNSYNCESVLYKALHKKSKSKPIWDLISGAETRMLRDCDIVLYCSEDDLTEFKQLVPKFKYVAVFAPNGMNPLSNVNRQLKGNKISSVVFIGSGHPPNVEAALHIIKNIAPSLPNLTFHIIGGCLPEGKYPKNVVRYGFVDDTIKEKLIRNSDLAINPMGGGSGSNVKIFDFFSYALPVLSTAFGMRGIDAEDEKNCLISHLTDFSGTIKLWSERYDELLKIGLNGQKLAAEKYSWDNITQIVSNALLEFEVEGGFLEKFILVLNDYDSFNNNGGGGVRTREIYKVVSEWCPIVFICFSDNEEINVRREFENIIIFSIPKTKKHVEELWKYNSCFHVSVDDIVAHRQCVSNSLFIFVYNILKKHSRNIVVEHPYLARIPISCNDRFVYSSQNYETQIKKDLLKYHPFYDELIHDVVNLEKMVVERASNIIAVSKEDANAFVKDVRTAAPVIIIPNGASTPLKPEYTDLVTVKTKINKDKAVVFVGSAHMPNIDALNYIVDFLAPSCPMIEFHIVGSVCNSFSSKKNSNIHFWGILSESKKSAVMRTCKVAINPVVSGGGSNIKLADYFANGLYVVTTPFGLRGYPDSILNHLSEAPLNDFTKAVNEALLKVSHENSANRTKRCQFFNDHLSMKSKALGVMSLLKSLEKPKKKVLVVTYRYTEPEFGGAENMIANLITAMDRTDDFQIDVVSPQVSKITNLGRFAENYEFDSKIGVKIGLTNVRFARFPLSSGINISQKVNSAWQAQPYFEKHVYQLLKKSFKLSGLAWGWGESEIGSAAARWGFTSCGLHLYKNTKIQIKGYAPTDIVITIKDDNENLIISKKIIQGGFEVSFTCISGTVSITTSIATSINDDVRPLAFYITEIRFDGEFFDLAKPLLPVTSDVCDKERFRVLDKSCETIRTSLDIKLTSMRGPFSETLEHYLKCNVQNYDLVVTHNNVFRPAIIAVEEANNKGIPVISIPHAHLDDDFYHFPDVHKSIIDSDLVLASPKLACEFYESKGAKVSYLPAGINTKEVFSKEDVDAFNRVFSIDKPFVLVLGRKSNAKGYEKVIRAVNKINKETDIHLIMIGPDDDNLPLNSSSATYLGRQPREIVRGALQSCIALVNMSTSESFGIVLLEAWMAGKPVIANNACPAFHDIATHEINALLVDDASALEHAIRRIITEKSLCKRLANNGQAIIKDYDWESIGNIFTDSCNKLINNQNKFFCTHNAEIK